MRDPYFYPNTEVLRNRLHIMDEQKLREAEADYVVLNLAEIAVGHSFEVFDFTSLCEMHYRIFRDVFDWAGKPRIVNIEKAEAPLGGMSVEYSDVFAVADDAEAVLAEMNHFPWRQAVFDDMVKYFSGYMADLWKVHPFREGNTRTIVTYCAMFMEKQGVGIDSALFAENIEYMRNALVAASAVFSGLGDLRRPEYLYRIVRDALERGNCFKAYGK